MKGKSKAPILLLVLLIASLGLSACGPQDQDVDLVTSGKREMSIVNGTAVEPTDRVALSTVALYYVLPRSAHANSAVFNFCSGTLISKTVVLTAAHCLVDVAQEFGIPVEELIKSVQIGFGTEIAKNSGDSRVQFRKIASVRVHEKYKVGSEKTARTEPDYDIALVRLAQRAPENAVPVRLLVNSGALGVGRGLILAGFGLVSKFPEEKKAERLMKVDVVIDNPAVNSVQFSYKVVDGKSACSGDSGGPAYVKTKTGELLVAGVTSWGDPYCALIGAYTSVPAFIPWIRDTIPTL